MGIETPDGGEEESDSCKNQEVLQLNPCDNVLFSVDARDGGQEHKSEESRTQTYIIETENPIEHFPDTGGDPHTQQDSSTSTVAVAIRHSQGCPCNREDLVGHHGEVGQQKRRNYIMLV
jgi:hypothetical protein